MAYTITIADGVNTVTLSPGATMRRTIDTAMGYGIMDRAGQALPNVRDRKMTRELIEIQTTFKGRRADYDKLFTTMISGRTTGTAFTLTVQRKTGTNETYTVIPYPRAIDQRDPGSGEMDNVILSFLRVGAVS
uniref:Tail protein n=1 Tax=viral metagenome TaxID=1070528 RepID=A0A6H2A2Y8_9ZZZZ